MKKRYIIELVGCADTTVFEMDLDKNELAILEIVAEKSRGASDYDCMPTMQITSVGSDSE